MLSIEQNTRLPAADDHIVGLAAVGRRQGHGRRSLAGLWGVARPDRVGDWEKVSRSELLAGKPPEWEARRP